MSRPVTGDKVKCEGCGKIYSYYIWAMGSDRCYCRTCVSKRPQACLDDDAIDMDEKQIMRYDEQAEQERIFNKH